MSESNDITLLHVQRKIKPKIEEVIPFIVDGDNQKYALDFVAWLRENKMAPGWSGVHNAWDAKCRGSTICKISLRNAGWDLNENLKKHSWCIKLFFSPIHQYEETVIKEGLGDVILNNFVPCVSCLNGKKDCKPGITGTFLGKDFKNICIHSFNKEIKDPKESTLNGIKKLLELEQKARTESAK